jgi:prepilin-type N-terminal cleavage/methylation domain-containing protein
MPITEDKTGKIGRAGFTLVEIAIVMVIIGILAGGGVSLIRVLTERNMRNATADYLKQTRSALISFVVNQGRLPYADSDGDGLENGPGAGSATNGTLPYLTLQTPPTDAYRRTLHYEVNANLVSDRSATCSAIRAGLAARPMMVDGDGVGTSFPVAAVFVSAGPMDADHNGNVFDAIGSGTFQGNNISGSPNYLRHPPMETTFDDLTAYVGGNELFSQICEYVDLAVNNTTTAAVVVFDLNTGSAIGTVPATSAATFSVISGTRIELRNGGGATVPSTPTTPIALAGRGEALAVP